MIDMNTEQWKEVPGFSDYDVSNWGNVRSYLRRGRHQIHGRHSGSEPRNLPQATHWTGHLRVRLKSDEGKFKQWFSHSLVLTAFVGQRPSGLECRHLDGNPANNRLDNLCWGTRAENMADMERHGTRARGQLHGFAKLDDDSVQEAIRLRKGGWHYNKLARHYGVAISTIFQAVNGHNWKHLHAG